MPEDKWVEELMPEWTWCIKQMGVQFDCDTNNDPSSPPMSWGRFPPGPEWVDKDPDWFTLYRELGSFFYDWEGKWEVIDTGVWREWLQEWELLDCYYDELSESYKKTWELWYAKYSIVKVTWLRITEGVPLGGGMEGLLSCFSSRIGDFGIHLEKKE